MSEPKTVTVTNTGTAIVTIRDILTSGIDFAQTNDCGTSLAAGASCSVKVTFKPAIPGTRMGALYIVASDPATPHLIGITGVGE